MSTQRDATGELADSDRWVDRACWCGATTASEAFCARVDDLDLQVVRCAGCGVYALASPPTAAQLAAYYAPDYYGSTRRKFVGPVARAIDRFQAGRARLVARNLPPPGRVLDVGCGNGGFLVQLRERGYTVEGTELSAQSAVRVPPGSAIPVHVGDLLQLDLPDGAYDAVTMWHVLEHLADPYATLHRVHRLLKPGGVLMLALPNAEGWQARWFGRHWLHLDPPRHLYGFGPQSLATMLRTAGFDVRSCHTWSLEQNPFGLAQSVLNAAGFPRDRAYDTLKGVARGGALAKGIDLSLVGILAGPSLLWSSLESLFGRGATMTVIARR